MAKERKRRGLMIPLLVAVTLVLASVEGVPVRQLASQGGQREEVTARLQEVQAENARLEREIEVLHSPNAIERIARADFGYVRPGEVSYVVLAPDEDPTAGSEPVTTETVEVPDSSGFWEALWGYVTGSDAIDG